MECRRKKPDIKPLSRKTKEGKRYVRRTDVTKEITDVLSFEEVELFAKVTSDLEFSLSLRAETLIYLIRMYYRRNSEIAKILLGALLRKCEPLIKSWTKERFREYSDDIYHDTVVTLAKLISERENKRLDFAEVQFNLFLKSLVIDQRRKYCPALQVDKTRAYGEDQENYEEEVIEAIISSEIHSRIIEDIAFKEAISSIKPTQAQIAAYLYFIEGLTYKHIAKHLNRSDRTIQTWIVKARKHLQEYYKDYEERGIALGD